MPTPKRATSGEMPKHIEIAYKDALDNLMFIKKQQWLITSYVLTAYAALFSAAQILSVGCLGKLGFTLAVGLLAAYSLLILDSLRRAIEKFRKRLAWIYQKSFQDDERARLHLDEPKGWFNRLGLVTGLMVVSAIGAIISVVAIILITAPVPGP